LDFGKYEQLSFTDAVSLALMTRHRIREIYSHDKDFDLKGIVRKERP
jgi:predicted nucleic acid-binding protein